MTDAEYRSKKAALEDSHGKEIAKLMREFAESNSNVKRGDIIQDNIGGIRVAKSYMHIPITGSPRMKHQGVMLTVKGVEFKSGQQRTISQENILEDWENIDD